MKVGILTGGGDCPGLNAVIRATAKSLLRPPEYGFCLACQRHLRQEAGDEEKQIGRAHV